MKTQRVIGLLVGLLAQATLAIEATCLCALVPEPTAATHRITSHALKGASGREIFEVGTRDPDAAPFDHARIAIDGQRFADIRIMSTPRRGCRSCDALEVLWTHEPTGYLRAEVEIYRQHLTPYCCRPPKAASLTKIGDSPTPPSGSASTCSQPLDTS